MKINYDVEIEEGKRGSVVRSEEGLAILEFLKRPQKNMCFEYSDEEEAKKRAGCVSNMCKKVNQEGEMKISYTKRNNKIYVLKEE